MKTPPMPACNGAMCRQGRRPCSDTACGFSPLITANSDGSSSDEGTKPDTAAKWMVIAVVITALAAAAASVVVR